MTTRYFLGGAIPIPEVKTYLFAGTWAGADWASITINGKTLTLTLTAGDTLTTVAVCAAMIDLINGAAANENEKRSALGTTVGEFLVLTATVGATTSTLKLTGKSDGRPIGTVTLDSSTAGDGTFAAVGGGDDVTGTGPTFYSNAANWSGGAVPVNSDVICWDHQASNSCLYGLDQSAVTPTSVTVSKSFRYAIGLPEVNRDSATYPYAEHQATYLAYAAGTTVTIDGSGAQMIKIDSTTGACTYTVTGSGTTAEAGTPSVLLKGSNAANSLTVTSGNVGYCFEAVTTGTLTTLFVGGGASPSLEIGSGVTVTTISQSSGSIVNRATATVTTLTMTGGTFTHHGGTITTANIAGTFTHAGAGTITTAYVTNGGTIDCTKDPRGRTITNYHMYAGALKDPLGTITFTNGLKVYAKPTEVTLDLPARRTYTLSAI